VTDDQSSLTHRERLIEYIEDTEYDREVLPHYGLIPDWFIRYKELRDLTCAFLNSLEYSKDVDERASEDTHK
jgi:hypothetical protein